MGGEGVPKVTWCDAGKASEDVSSHPNERKAWRKTLPLSPILSPFPPSLSLYLWLSSFDRKEPLFVAFYPFSRSHVRFWGGRKDCCCWWNNGGEDCIMFCCNDNEHNGRRNSFVKWVTRCRSRSQMILFKSRVISDNCLPTHSQEGRYWSLVFIFVV